MTPVRLLPVLFAVWIGGCSDSRVKAGGAPLKAVGVSTVPVVQTDWPELYEASGTVRARTATVLSARWMGYVREVKVGVGDHVREGQLLVVLDARDLDASSNRASAAREEVRNGIPEADSAVIAARANLDLSQVTFRRMKDLYNRKSISDQEFDEASSKVKASQAAYDMARARRTQMDSRLAQADQEVGSAKVARSYAEIQAPFAGIVTVRSADPGTVAVPGAPLLTLEREAYRLEASVEESKIGAIHRGQAVSVTLDGAGPSLESHVSEIVPSVDAASRTIVVKIDLPVMPLLRSGMFGRAVFTLSNHKVLTIPMAAVSERGQIQSVYVESEGTAQMRLVTLGGKREDRVEVLSGLNDGENVVVPIPLGLSDGVPIEARP